MCGIFAYLNNTVNDSIVSNDISNSKFMNKIEECFNKDKNRGPEKTTMTIHNNIFLGFHRLAINGLDNNSSQPLTHNNISLICNGEIYNYKELIRKIQKYKPSFKVNTNSDCEIVIHLYEMYGIEQTLKILDGVFSFVLYDYRDEDKKSCYIARDPYGVRPLYQLKYCNNYVAVASTMKMLNELILDDKYTISQFTPSTYLKLNYVDSKEKWFYCYNKEYNIMPMITEFNYTETITLLDDNDYLNFKPDKYLENIRSYFTRAVEKRVDNTDRPIACLLSGGLDSSIVTSIVNKVLKQRFPDVTLETYSIGLKGGEDLYYAKKVAEFLGTKHNEIIFTEKDFLDAIPNVIYTVESYDTTTVRASVGNYLVAKYISENSKAKVIFNGDGSDELMGGYLYFQNAPDEIEFDKECRRLLKNIHYFDGLRSDRSISSNGLEPRTPFLDRSWVQYYLSIPTHIRFPKNNKECEKYLFRLAFDVKFSGEDYLPTEVLWRTKEAFSDGVSKQTRSWYEIINEHVSTKLDKKLYQKLMNFEKEKHNNPETLEQKYYRYIFNNHYKYCDKTIPYFWMPKYSDATDSSARTLKNYKKI